MNVKDTRRTNLRAIAQQVGGITAISKLLKKSQSQISHLIGLRPVKNIGDKLACEVERCFNKTPGWMDREHDEFKNHDTAQPNCEQRFTWIPILDSSQLLNTELNKIEVKDNKYTLLPSNKHLGHNLFALQITNEELLGIRLRPQVKINALAIIEPHARLENYGYVLAATHMSEIPKIRQVIADEHGRHLAALTPNDPKLPLNEQTKLYGVVKQIILNLV